MKQPYAFRTPLGWTVVGPVLQAASGGRDANHMKSAMGPQTKQLGLLQNTEFKDDGWVRTAPSTDDQLTVKMATKTITLKVGHYELGRCLSDTGG